MNCLCVKCECINGVMWRPFGSIELKAHRTDDLDEPEMCEYCDGTGVREMCDECAGYERECVEADI
jgi:hypothetical protein